MVVAVWLFGVGYVGAFELADCIYNTSDNKFVTNLIKTNTN
jgi:hypothetical protein